MFRNILVANRGEIAVRVIRACKELGVRTVAVYSEADADSMHVQLADEAICIGPGPSSGSYLKADAIMSAADIANVDAIHPGYGFLSENPRFAEICESCGVKFIGPPAEVISMMGDKNRARATATKYGIPVSPGTKGIVKDEAEAARLVLLAAGGVDPAATDADLVHRNNRAATLAALLAGRAHQPSLADVLAARHQPTNPFFTPG